MTIATYSKVAIASLVVLFVGIGGTAIPLLGIGDVHGADEAVRISSPTVSTTEQGPATFTVVQPAVSVAQTSLPPAVQPTNASSVAPWENQVRLNSQSAPRTWSASPRVSGQTSDSVFRALIEALGDSETEVQHTAAKTLASIGRGRQDVIAAFANTIQHSKDKKLRYYAIAGLGRIGGDDLNAAKTLSSVLEDDSDTVFRIAAVEALGRIVMGNDVALSLAAALKDSDVKVRVAAAKVLGKLNRGNNPGVRAFSLPRELDESAAPESSQQPAENGLLRTILEIGR